MKRRKLTGKINSKVKTVAIGAGISIGVGVALAMLCAKLILSGVMAEGWLHIAAGGILFLAVLCGSLFIAKRLEQQKLPLGMLCPAIVLLVLSVLHALLIPSDYTNLPILCGCAVAGGLVGGLAGIGRGGKRRYR